MTEDIETLREWMKIFVCLAAIATTAVPVVYSFSPWWKSPLGRVIMFKAVAIGFAVDLTAAITFWPPKSILIIFWANVFILSAITISAGSLAWMIWRINHSPRKRYAMLFSGPLYDFLKKVVQIVLPALSTLYFTIAQIWHLMYAAEVSGTIAALALFLGILLGLSTKTYNDNKPDKIYDGEFEVTPGADGDGDIFRLKSIDLRALETKSELVFKVYGQKIEPIQ